MKFDIMNLLIRILKLFPIVSLIPFFAHSQVFSDTLSPEALVLKAKINLGSAEYFYQTDTQRVRQLQHLRSSINELTNILEESGYSEDTQYYKILSNDIALIKRLIVDTAHFVKIVSYLNRSFELKIKYNSVSGFHDNAVFDKIIVNVRVVKKNIDQQGYEVACNTLFWEDKPPVLHANDNTSPTKMVLPPGDYVFYIIKDKFSTKFYRTVGAEQKQSQDLKFTLDQ